MIKSLQCDVSRGAAYRNPTQIARVITEEWCCHNIYCTACDSERLEPTAANTRAVDFRCGRCPQTYQVKSQRVLNLKRVTDGAYSAMVAALKHNSAPNLLILNYTAAWSVSNLYLIPSVFLTSSVLEKRKPLGPDARRAGWTGCNFLLSGVPAEGKIALVSNGAVVSEKTVRERHNTYQKLEAVKWESRGWALDVLRAIQRIRSDQFSLDKVYEYERELMSLHPNNRNIRAKMRQQLQVLRDHGFIEFLGQGTYRFRANSKHKDQMTV